VAFSHGLSIYKIKTRFNKFGPFFSSTSCLPHVIIKVECQFSLKNLVEKNLGYLFNDLYVATCHVQN
jgi:hypothetical protein